MGAALKTPLARTASWYGGAGSLSGNVKDDTGTNASRTVLVTDAFSDVLIRKTVSGADGNYSIPDLRKGLVVDIRYKDDAAGTTYKDLVDSRVVIA